MPPTLRDRHKHDTRTSLVDAALHLFAEHGYARATVEEICDRAGVSSRTFFRYFPNKDEVLAAPITELLETVAAALAGRPDRAAWPALRAAVLAAEGTVDGRRDLFVRVAQVVHDNPGVLASNARAFLQWEEATRGQVATRLGCPADALAPRLLLGVTMTAFRSALDLWTVSSTREPLRVLLEEALDAVAPGARAIERSVRRTT